MIDLEKLSHEEKEALAEDCEDFLLHRNIPLRFKLMYFIYLRKLLRRGRMIIQCLQLTEELENPQKTSSAFGLGGFLRIFHASARCKHRIIPLCSCSGDSEFAR